MEIKGISQKIFKTNQASSEKNSNQANHTNPFGVYLKGNIINADVFEPSFAGKEKIAQKAVDKISGVRNKLADAINVGSINSFVERVRAYGKRITDGATKLWNTAKSIEINVKLPNLVEELTEARAYSNRALDAQSSNALGENLQAILASV